MLVQLRLENFLEMKLELLLIDLEMWNLKQELMKMLVCYFEQVLLLEMSNFEWALLFPKKSQQY